MSLWNLLNPVQRDAVRTLEGPVMIVAGAGSGKTRVLTYRIAYMLECGVPAHHVLALTFTNKAAREMRERITQLVPGEEAQRLWMGTFHATFARLLRRDADKIGFHRNFSIYDSDDSQGLVKSIMSDLGINTQQYSPSAVRHAISRAKNAMVGADAFARSAKEIFEKKTADVYAEYAARLRASNAMDFDDLILHPIELFDRHPDVLAAYQRQFRFILIDEYQDTNQAQFQIVRRLASEHGNICVVGDDAQSIYAFRGADIRNILEFERVFSNVRTFRLEQNYRSTKKILQGADALIRHNTNQIRKNLWTDNADGEAISILETADEQEEARRILFLLQEESLRRKLQLKDFAVLYRTNAQSRAVEDVLRRSGISYTIVGGIEFYRRKEIKDVLAYLRLIVNPSDDEAALRIINYPSRGIGDTTIQHLRAYAADQGVTLFESAMNAAGVPGLRKDASAKVGGFVQMIQKYASLRSKISAGELAASLVDELGLVQEFKMEGTPEARSRLENIQELLSALAQYAGEHAAGNGNGTLEGFLAEASLVADIDSLDENRNAVTLMTLHAAKGLEFPVVFLAGMEEGLFPSSMSIDKDQVEEERRLCYVGMTRAMQKLYLLYARSRMRWGQRADQMPSRFLDELDPAAVVRESTRRASGPYRSPSVHDTRASSADRERARVHKKRTATEYGQEGHDSYSQIEDELRIGATVIHAIFGRGKILDLQGSGDQARAIVVFESVGRKTLILKFAGLHVTA